MIDATAGGDIGSKGAPQRHDPKRDFLTDDEPERADGFCLRQNSFGGRACTLIVCAKGYTAGRARASAGEDDHGPVALETPDARSHLSSNTNISH